MAERESNGGQRGEPVVVIAGTGPLFKELGAALRREGLPSTVASSLSGLEALLQAYGAASVVVLDADDPAFGLQALQLLRDPHPFPTLLLLEPQTLAKLAPSYISAQYSNELAFKPLAEEALVLHVKALLVKAGFSLPSAPDGMTVDSLAGRYTGGRSVLVFSAKGGVGKTTLAVNAAVALCRMLELRVLLVDADLWFGDVGVLMNLPLERSAYDLPAEFDLDNLQRVLVKHESGVVVLTSPPDPTMVERMPAGIISRAVSIARAVFDFVLVDTQSTFDEMNLGLMELVDSILVVTTPEISAVRNTARFMQLSRSMNLDHKVRLVLNRANSGISQQSVERTFGQKFDVTIVSDGKLVVQSANEGVPVLQRDPHAEHQVSRDLRELAGLIAGQHLHETHRGFKGFFPWGRRDT